MATGRATRTSNFLIPELVSGIQYRKGTYAAESGDFSAAGNIRVNYMNVLDGPLVRLEGGTYGYGRVLAAASPKLGKGHASRRRRRHGQRRPVGSP